jgi:hypothetical protein
MDLMFTRSWIETWAIYRLRRYAGNGCAPHRDRRRHPVRIIAAIEISWGDPDLVAHSAHRQRRGRWSASI